MKFDKVSLTLFASISILSGQVLSQNPSYPLSSTISGYDEVNASQLLLPGTGIYGLT